MWIEIDTDNPTPIYRQIALAIKEQVHTGKVVPGETLPGVRELAASLGVNLHTVRHAYQELQRAKVLRLGLGRRARVLPPSPQPPGKRELRERLLPRLREVVADARQQGLSREQLERLWREELRKGYARKGNP